jgi:hypothetical protein
MSSVYQQSSANNPRYAQVDPHNRLLWRANIRRLEFEPLRDSLLAIGGTLDRTMYGKSVDLTKEGTTRRSVYGYIDRQNPTDVLVNFDFANPDMTNGKRHQTTVPQQALYFMNSPLVVESAKKLVSRPNFVTLSSDEERIRMLYLTLYQRPPKPEELALGKEFVSQAPSEERVTIASAPAMNAKRKAAQAAAAATAANRKNLRGGKEQLQARTPLDAWQEYAHALFQANEFSFVQ